tara:strand:- start:62 stop:523 length:462 start_codon:yes stop_codon:yes gene_type:complete
MKEVRGLLDYTDNWELPDVKIFTGNATVKSNGELVMGRGAALQVRDNHRGISKALGTLIKPQLVVGNEFYGFALCQAASPRQLIGIFQVKTYYSNFADIELIQRSTNMLKQIAEAKPQLIFHMNYPGIGHGKLKYKHIQDIVSILPDNVILYK